MSSPTKLCGEDDLCDALDNGGLRVTTTLDAGLQKTAEKWVAAAAIVPRSKTPAAAARALGFKRLEPWMANLRGKDLHNSALVAVDYQTGELVAYVGSADYYATSTKKSFQPQYDVVGKGYRQPGSAFKPFNYAVGIDDGKITAGTMLMDVATDFGGGYTPNNADRLERGPVRVRNALQFSLNIPAVKAMAINTPDRVFAKAQEFGMVFQGKRTAELALALGVQEVRPVDLVSAYGTLANGGKAIPHTTILTIKDKDGQDQVEPYVPPAGKQVVSPQAAYIVTDILAGNTNPNVNPFWGEFALDGPDGRRPATLKTGTNNDAKDLNAYGYIAPPSEQARTDGAYALAVGVWNGNSDNSLVSTARAPLFSIDVSTHVWQGFLNEAAGKWPVTELRSAGWPDAGQDRPVDGPGVVSQRRGRRVVHRRIRADPAGRGGHLRHRRRRRGQGRDRVRRVDEGRSATGSAAPSADRAWRAAPTEPGPRTSTTARSSRTARRGASSSPGSAASRARPHRASWCRRRTPAA